MGMTRGLTLLALAIAALLAGVPPVAAQSGKLVLYTSQPDRDAAQTVAEFRKAHPAVEVEIFRSGTVEVMGRLAAEIAGGAPKADVLLIADAVSLETLKRDGRLLAYPEAKVEGYKDGTFDKDRTYFGTKLITTGIAFNTAAKLRPTSWKDLVRPELKGQVSMPSPLYSGAAAIMLSAMTARSDLGWEFFEGLKGGDAQAVRGNGAVLKSVASGERSYGVLVDLANLRGGPDNITVIVARVGQVDPRWAAQGWSSNRIHDRASP